MGNALYGVRHGIFDEWEVPKRITRARLIRSAREIREDYASLDRSGGLRLFHSSSPNARRTSRILAQGLQDVIDEVIEDADFRQPDGPELQRAFDELAIQDAVVVLHGSTVSPLNRRYADAAIIPCGLWHRFA